MVRWGIHAVGLTVMCLVFASNAHAEPEISLSGKHVLVIPLAGDAADAGDLNTAIGAAVTATGATVVSAKVRKSDIAAITGCAADSADCYDQTASMLGVDHIVFGKITQSDGGQVVSMSLVGGQQNPRVGDIKLERGATRVQAFQAATKRFLLGTPELTSAPIAAPTPAPTDTGDQQSGFSLSRVKGYTWGVLGAGVAMTGTGVVLLMLARGKQSEVNDAPTATAADLDRLADLESSGKSLTTWGNVLFIAGGITTVAGAVLATKQGRRPADSSRVSVTPTASGNGLALSLGGRF